MIIKEIIGITHQYLKYPCAFTQECSARVHEKRKKSKIFSINSSCNDRRIIVPRFVDRNRSDSVENDVN
jgi:hypothetical protein